MKRVTFYLIVSFLMRGIGALLVLGSAGLLVVVGHMLNSGERTFFLKGLGLGAGLLFWGFFLDIPETLLRRIESLERASGNNQEKEKPTMR